MKLALSVKDMKHYIVGGRNGRVRQGDRYNSPRTLDESLNKTSYL